MIANGKLLVRQSSVCLLPSDCNKDYHQGPVVPALAPPTSPAPQHPQLIVIRFDQLPRLLILICFQLGILLISLLSHRLLPDIGKQSELDGISSCLPPGLNTPSAINPPATILSQTFFLVTCCCHFPAVLTLDSVQAQVQ